MLRKSLDNLNTPEINFACEYSEMMKNKTIPLSEDLNTHDRAILDESLREYVRSLDYENFEFLISLRVAPEISDVKSLQNLIEDSLNSFIGSKDVQNILYSLLDEFNMNIDSETEDIEKLLTEVILTRKHSYWQRYIQDSKSPRQTQKAVFNLINIILAKRLQQIISDRINKEYCSNPQDLLQIMSFFNEERPLYVLIVDSLIGIILGDVFGIAEKGRACRTLINNYKIENTLLYILNNDKLDEHQKDNICAWLRAFQKVYRKFLSILYDRKEENAKVANKWFKTDEIAPIPDTQIPIWVSQFIRCFEDNNMDEALEKGRKLILSVDSEDILRLLHTIFQANSTFSSDRNFRKKIYAFLYAIIEDYRKLRSEEKSSMGTLKSKFSDVSQDRRESESTYSFVRGEKDFTPVLGEIIKHPFINTTEENLKKGNMLHLFNMWPIPETSQEVFNKVCELKEHIPPGKEFKIDHLLFRETLLAFLMRLDRIGIKIRRKKGLPLITNAVQLNAHHLIRPGTFIGSTGYWEEHTKQPPSVLCFVKPHTIFNCRSEPLIHLVFRLYTGTGELYKSPFKIDSTPRFGKIDEEPGLDSLRIRMGLFLLDIPPDILSHWKKIQQEQLKQWAPLIRRAILEANRSAIK